MVARRISRFSNWRSAAGVGALGGLVHRQEQSEVPALVDYQRSRFWRKEYGGILTKKHAIIWVTMKRKLTPREIFFKI